MQIAGTMLAATILGLEGAVSGDVPRSVALPAEARGGMRWSSCSLGISSGPWARGRRGEVFRGRGLVGWGVMLT